MNAIVKYMMMGFLLMISSYARAQTKPVAPPAAKQPEPTRTGITFMFGPSGYYYQGASSGSYDVFEMKRVSYQLNGFFGYVSPNKGHNAIGVFGTAGYTNETIFNEMLQLQNKETDELVINKFFTFYQVEAGMIVARTLRLSSGVGKQNFTTVNGNDEFYYLSTTIGLIFDIGPVYWNIDANFNYGRDWPSTALKVSTGFLVKF